MFLSFGKTFDDILYFNHHFVSMNYPWQKFSQIIDHEIGTRLKLPISSLWNEKLSIACSGGMDSICLVLILYARFSKNQLTILHYNHNTRGQETDNDEIFVRQLADNLDIEFFSEKRSQGTITEEILRMRRYDFFSRIMRKLESRYLLLGHHGDDVIETMLMRLARGSTEIAAPKYWQSFQDGTYRIRPLITILKKEIIELFARNQIPWREDSSNHENHYLRNRIRQITPFFDGIFDKRDWKKGYLLAHRYLEEDATCLNQMAKSLCTDSKKLNLQKISHSAIIRRAIQFWLHDFSLTRLCFEKIFEAITKNYFAKISIDSKTLITIDQKILSRVSKPSNVCKMSFKNWQFGDLYLPTGYKLTRKIVPFSLKNITLEKINSSIVYVDSQICAKISMRTWQYGDSYQPINGPIKSVKKLFSEKKIPVEQRSILPVFCDENGLLIWIPHLPPADFVKVKNNFALKITFSST